MAHPGLKQEILIIFGTSDVIDLLRSGWGFSIFTVYQRTPEIENSEACRVFYTKGIPGQLYLVLFCHFESFQLKNNVSSLIY